MPYKNPEMARIHQREYNATHRAERRAYNLRYIAEHRDFCRECKRNWSKTAKGRECTARATRTKRARCEVDAAFYAQFRAAYRIRAAKKRLLAGKVYKPRFAKRIPDNCTKRAVLDVRSAYLAVNATFEQNAFARDLAIERKNRRTA